VSRSVGVIGVIGVIVPAYNEQDLIPSCLASVRRAARAVARPSVSLAAGVLAG
jgi:hypothetical protein